MQRHVRPTEAWSVSDEVLASDVETLCRATNFQMSWLFKGPPSNVLFEVRRHNDLSCVANGVVLKKYAGPFIMSRRSI